MKNRHYPLAMGISSVLLTFFVIGCTQPVSDRARTNEIPPDVRGGANHGRLGAKELENTTDSMLASIVASLEDLERDETGRTVIVLDRMMNRTVFPSEDFELFLVQLRRKLNQSGARYQIVFVENPERARAVRNRVLEEPLKDDYEEPGLRPHYALAGEVHALDRPGERYWEVFFHLLDLNPEGRYRNEIRWEDSRNYRFVR